MSASSGMTLLIDADNVSGESRPFVISDQVTVYAMGLDPSDFVEFEMVMLSGPIAASCNCPPLAVTLPSVVDAQLLVCCGQEIQLSIDRPYVVLDAPQNVLIRARLVSINPLDTQRVWLTKTNTRTPTDYMRGCSCGG